MGTMRDHEDLSTFEALILALLMEDDHSAEEVAASITDPYVQTRGLATAAKAWAAAGASPATSSRTGTTATWI